jgi:hypothetical protein
MHCAFINTERLDHRGRHVHKCANCGREVGSKYADPGMLTAICSEDPGKPGLIRRAMNFTRAAVGHARSGFRRVSDEAREERRAICSKCPLFDGSICTHKDCGCPIKDSSAFIDKLSWASSKCPLDPPKWTAHANTCTLNSRP